MYHPQQQQDINRLTKYISLTSPKYKSAQHPIITSIQKLNNLQQVRFQQIEKACSFLEACVLNTEETLSKLQQRIQELQELKSTETISNLKQKQNEFIIHQLKDKIKKYQKNQQNLQIEIKHLKKQLENLKRLSKQNTNDRTLKDSRNQNELEQLEKIIHQKDQEIDRLTIKMEKLEKQKREQKKLQAGKDDKIKKDKEGQFKVLEGKLMELQKDFDTKVTQLQQEVKDKTLQIKRLQIQLENKQKQIQFKDKQHQIQLKSLQQHKSPSSLQLTQSQQLPTSMLVTFNPARKSVTSPQQSQSSPSLYELQLKLSHQQTLYKELEQQHTTHLTQSNNLEIQLHQQIHQQKLQLQEEKKKAKEQKKKTVQLLQGLVSFVNKRTFNYFDPAQEIDLFVQEVKKLISKEKEKWEKDLIEAKNLQKELQDKISQLQKDIRKLKNQNNLLKNQLESTQENLQRLISQRQKQKQKQRQKEKQRQRQKSKKQIKRQNSSNVTESPNNSQIVLKKQSLNGSLGEISNNCRSETTSFMEEKYKTVIEALKAEIQQKEQQIAELETLQAVDFEKSKEKILAIESELADARNESRKLERQVKELKQKLAQQTKQSQSLRTSIQELKEKNVKQKQQLTINQEQKVKSLEQKLSKLKQQNQQIDSKCQEKVMKYNKLKTKVEKLEMYNSETEKRKDSQIEDLIKKNQHLKMECKLLEEKLNIAQTLQLNTQTTDGSESSTQSTFVYNKDLIEQIQMERDRILEQYEGKRRECIKLKEANEKLEGEISKISQQINKYEQQKRKNQQQKQKQDQQKTKSQQEKQRQVQQSQKTITRLQEQKQSLISQISQLKKQINSQKLSKQSTQKQLARISQEQSSKSKQEYQHLKKQLQNQLQARKKLQKQQPTLIERIKQLKEQNEKLKKDMQEKAKSLEVRWQDKYKEKTSHHQEEITKIKDEHQRKMKDLQQKLSQAQIREENLVNIINYKNMSVSGNVRDSMRGDEDENRNNLKENQNNVNEEVKKYDFNEFLPISEVKEINFGEMVDQGTSMEDKAMCLDIFEVVNASVEPFVLSSKLSIEVLPMICVRNQIEYEDQKVGANIFEQPDELMRYFESQYPSIIEQIIKSHESLDNSCKQQQKQQMAGEVKQFTQIGVNTQVIQRKSQKVSNSNRESINNRQSIKSSAKETSFILQKDWLGSDEPSHSSVQQTPIPDSNPNLPQPRICSRQKFDPQSNKVGHINLFQNLKPQNLNLQIGLDEQNIDDNFEICEEGESINVGRTALNLQIREIFNKLREELEKVFNGEEISLSMIKILPRQLEDDYNEFISYVREKIGQIKVENQLSFIMAEVGDSPQQIQQELDNELKNFLMKQTQEDIFTYKKLVQQKQALITSLINERTLQQNTINQMTMEKQELDEQHENRFMNQCNIYKKEIKELKNKVDNLEMNFQSLKNIFKNTMEIWVDQMENQDDLRDNFTVYKKIAKLTELESTRLNYYIFRYKEIKGIEE